MRANEFEGTYRFELAPLGPSPRPRTTRARAQHGESEHNSCHSPHPPPHPTNALPRSTRPRLHPPQPAPLTGTKHEIRRLDRHGGEVARLRDEAPEGP